MIPPFKIFFLSLDRWLFLLAFIGIGFLGYALGAAAIYYRLPSSGVLSEAFQASEAWYEVLQTTRKRKTSEKKTVSALTVDKNTGVISPSRTIWNKESAYQGYTLISLRFSTTAYLLDMNGRVVHQWDMPFLKAWPDPEHIHSLARAKVFIAKAHVYPNGDLLALYMGSGDTPYGYGMVKMDKDSNVLWTYDENTHHDFYLDQEGFIYVIVHELLKNPGQAEHDFSNTVLTDYIVKLSPEGKEISRISILDAFKNSDFSSMLESLVRKRKHAWDYFHTNTVMKLEPSIAKKFPMFKPNQILIAMRSLDAIAVIDPDTKKIIWAHKGDWKWPHAATFLDNGHIMVLDNLWDTPNKLRASRVLEFDPSTKKITWQFPGRDFFHMRTAIFGRLQRLPNGNTLIAETMNARLLEVTSEGKVAWEYGFKIPKNNAIITARRYIKQEVPFLADLSKEQ